MSDLFRHLYDYLASDTVLVGTQTSPPTGPFSGVLTGGLWRRPIKRSSDPTVPSAGSTPGAFGGEGAEAGRIRYVATLLDEGERTHVQEFAIPTAMLYTFWVMFYAPAHDAGKAAIKNAQERIYDLLYDYRFVTDNGPLARVFYDGNSGIADSEEFIGAVSDFCRYQVVYRKREMA